MTNNSVDDYVLIRYMAISFVIGWDKGFCCFSEDEYNYSWSIRSDDKGGHSNCMSFFFLINTSQFRVLTISCVSLISSNNFFITLCED